MTGGRSGSLVTRYGSLWIALAVLIAYWPLTTFMYGLSEGDTLDCWLPWRHFIAASLQEGHLPSWNPLQQMGYPMHADLQGPAWYPEAIILGGTVGMGPHVLQVLFLLYVIIGGWGMRAFTERLVPDATPAVIAGTAYALSGFFTAHAMHFYAVISAAWLPWFLMALLKLTDAPGWRNALITSIFLFLLLTGGNHSFLIIAAYPMTVLVLWYAIRSIGKQDHAYLRSLIGHGMLAVGTAVVMACGTFHALWEVVPYIDRLKGLHLELAQQGPFTINALKSLIWPAAATATAEEMGTDPTMGNGYFGAIVLLFALIGWRAVKDGRIAILAGFVFLFALASFGEALPVHGWLWRFLPGFDLFRFPGYFWYFVMLFTLPFAAAGIARVLAGRSRREVLVLAAFLVLISFVVIVRNAWTGLAEPDAPMIDRMRNTPAGALVWANAIVLIGMLIALIAMCSRGIPRPRWLLLLVSIEMIAGIQFTQWYSTLGRYSPAELSDRIDALPHGPILPRMRPMRMNTDDSAVLHLLWRNTQNFHGHATHGGFNSFWMSAHARLTDDHREFQAHLLEEPLIFLADELIDDPSAGTIARVSADPGSLVPVEFTYEKLVIEADVPTEQFLVVQQNNYPGWRIMADGAELPVIAVNVAQFGAWLPAGTRSIAIFYHKPELRILSIVSFFTFFSILLLLAFTAEELRPFLIVAVVVLIGLWLFAVLGHRPKSEKIHRGWTEARSLLRESDRRTVLVNTDRRLPSNDQDYRTVRIDLPDEIFPLENAIAALPALPDTLVLGWRGLPINAASRAYLADVGYRSFNREGNADAGAIEFVHDPRDRKWPVLYQDRMEGGMKLHAQSEPWKRAWRKSIAELHDDGVKDLVISIQFRGKGACEAHLVIERRRNGKITDHETLPLCPIGRASEVEHRFVAVRPVPHQRFGGEELGIYAIALGDTVEVRDLLVRSMVPEP